MPKGVPTNIPDDGLTTAQRRNRPLLMVHTGDNKGKSTAAFGLGLRGWNQGWNVAVFQFVKSAKWKVGEETAYLALGRVHEETGQGGPIQWHKMGDGWSWSRKKGEDEDHAQVARDGWEEIKRRILAEEHDLYILDEFAYPLKWGWIDPAEVAAFLRDRPGHQHVVITGRNVAPEIIEVADLVTEMTKIKHPMDAGQKGQRGIEW
jgi:cob(I)alamin adenosyltransferase